MQALNRFISLVPDCLTFVSGVHNSSAFMIAFMIAFWRRP